MLCATGRSADCGGLDDNNQEHTHHRRGNKIMSILSIDTVVTLSKWLIFSA